MRRQREQNQVKDTEPSNKSFLVLFFKKEQDFFFEKKKQKTFSLKYRR
jgi:hypothetical protein